MRFKFIDRQPIEYIQYRITPDRTVDNKKVHEMFRALSSLYVSPLERLRNTKAAGELWWDIMLQEDDIRFYCTMPSAWKREFRSHLESIWPLASIEEVRTLQTVLPHHADVCELKYRRSNIFALQTDRRLELEPLQSLLSVSAELDAGETARLSVCVQPTSRLDWQEWAEQQHAEFKKGKTPRRTRLSKRDLFISIGETVTGLLQSILEVVHMAMGAEAEHATKGDDKDRRLLLMDGGLSKGTINKAAAPTFAVHIRLAACAEDSHRQTVLLRTLANSFHYLASDNELERCEIHPKLKPLILKELNTYRISWPTRIDWDRNVMSHEELGRIVELPTAALQDAYRGRMETLDARQIEVPVELTQGGLLLGGVSFKKHTVPVYQPTNDWDQLCLPTVTIGGMGSGKTTGFGCNRAVEFVRNGFSSILFDPAKSQMWDVVSNVLPEHQRKRVLLGKDPISLDFREVIHSPAARARLSQIILAFFDDATDTAGAQTQRFLRAAVMAMESGRISDIVQIFTIETFVIER